MSYEPTGDLGTRYTTPLQSAGPAKAGCKTCCAACADGPREPLSGFASDMPRQTLFFAVAIGGALWLLTRR